MFARLCALGTLSWLTVAGSAGEPAPGSRDAGMDFFESKIRPVLVGRCYDCHSSQAGAAEGGLQLDTRSGVLRGGGRGPAVVPGDAKASWLLTAISHSDPDLSMPPKQDRLDASVIADFKRWIELGAPDPRDDGDSKPATAWKKADRSFWAYQPPRAHKPPVVRDAAWPRTAVDAFVLEKLEQHGLAPSADAPPAVLLRRVHFDLVGLPPSPDELSEFLAQVELLGVEPALAREVERLLTSPQFGERWGRHWLDVARYAESSGKEANVTFPYAWRYRDYVIDCVNADLPFDRFLLEQIAGDLLPHDDDVERARLLIATGFLAIGPKNLDEMTPAQFEADVIDEQIDAVSRAVLANSIACARCHDHKFDPFTMEDYYALAGIFASTKTYFGTAVSPTNRVGGDPLVLPRNAGLAILHRSIPAEKVAELKAELVALQQEQEAGMAAVREAIAQGKDPGDRFTLRDALRIFWRSGAIEGDLEKVDDQGRALPLTMGVLDADTIRDAPLLQRGDVTKPGEPAARRLPVAFSNTASQSIPADQSGRLQLAHWLASADNPLTARVLVNRVWRRLFGAGLVRTVDNFGSTGEPPSHPELLDDLAVRFMENGWSVKRLVRDVVLSRTYRQASDYNPDAFQIDPENRFLWRMPKRRLDAEAIRDAMLFASGEIDLARPAGSLVGRVIGDRPVSLIGLDKRLPPDLDGAVHRSVYLPVLRDRLPDALELFDFAEPSLVTGDRETTNVPIQALYLMNSPFVADRAKGLAQRILSEAKEDEARIRRAFALCYCRQPDDVELQRALEFVTAWEDSADAGDLWIDFCQSLLCTGEFRNLD